MEWEGIQLDFAQTMHSVTNLAMRMVAGSESFCYSGDGMFTDASRDLFRGADLVIHEAYQFQPSPVHADIPSLLKMARTGGVNHLALVHLQRGLRREPGPVRDAMAQADGMTVTRQEPLTLLQFGLDRR